MGEDEVEEELEFEFEFETDTETEEEVENEDDEEEEFILLDIADSYLFFDLFLLRLTDCTAAVTNFSNSLMADIE